MSRKLDNKIALVTGGSRGIGRSICAELAREGAYVFINYSASENAAQDTLALCRENGGDGEILRFDVSSSEECDSSIETIKARKGGLDILVNNAGISRDGLLIRFKDEDWDKVLRTNLNGAFYCSRAAARLMIKARQGRIINVSSVVAQMGNAGQAAYVSSKAGLLGLTMSMARELAARNITVNAVAPGFIETEMTAVLDEKLQQEHKSAIPLGRFGKAEEVAALVSFLAGSESAYITGQVVGINGGMYM